MKLKQITPVFIIGCYRSGTTMLASQLGASQGAFALPEMPFLTWLILQEREKKEGVDIYGELIDLPRFKTLDIDLPRNEFILAWADSGLEGGLLFIIKTYFQARGLKFNVEQPYKWLEHCPKHVNEYYLLSKTFDNAKFIHMYRDPRALYSSMKNMSRWDIHDPIKFSTMWCAAVSKGFLLSNTFPDKVIEVKYEKYVQNIAELKHLCDFIELDFSNDMLNGGGVILPRFTQKQHKLTLGKSNTNRIDSWKDKIPSREAEVVSALCSEWMIHYDYIDKDSYYRSPTFNEKLYWAIKRSVLSIKSRILNFITFNKFFHEKIKN